jgi:hypothetical protein
MVGRGGNLTTTILRGIRAIIDLYAGTIEIAQRVAVGLTNADRGLWSIRLGGRGGAVCVTLSLVLALPIAHAIALLRLRVTVASKRTIPAIGFRGRGS